MNSDKQSSIPRFPTGLLALALVSTAATTVWLAWKVYDSNRFVEELKHRQIRCVQLQGKIIHLDEVLTMSARMAATTGDLNWEKRYRRYQPELDAAIKEVAQLAPQPALVQMAAQTDAANLKLVDMENRAFDLVQHGQLEPARGVLFNPAYEKQKQIYAEGITHLIEALNQQWSARLRSEEIDVRLSILVTGIVLAALLVAWFTAMRTLTRWRVAFQRVHDSLELRVRERTAELGKAGLEAQASEARRRAITDSAQDAILMMDPEGRVSYWNPAAERILGYTSAEAIGQNLHEFIAPARFHQAHHAAFPAFQQTGQGAAVGKTLDLEARRKDGIEISVQLSLSAIQINGGWHAVGILRDTTEIKRAEEALRASQQIIEGILNAIPVRVFWKDKNLVYLGCNAVFARDAGFADPKDIIGKDDFQMGWREQAELYRGDDRQVIESGGSKLLIEEPQTTPEGNTITLLTSKIPLRGPNGEVSGVLGMYMDITKRKRAEEKIQQLSRAVEQNPASIVITDPAGNIEYVNPKFVELTGYAVAEVLGQNPRVLKSGEKSPEAYRELWQTITAGKEWRGEFHNKKKNGELYWESASISPIRDLAGRITHYVAVKEDITARKQTEAERGQLIRELQQALASVKSLSGLLPICAGCKKIRDDTGYWSQVESYIQTHSEAKFTHGLCPDCIKKYYPDLEEAGRPSR